jgi:hypothetical protein
MNAEAGADASRGVPRPDVAERMRRAHKQEDIARHIRGHYPGGRPWTPEEDALLGTLPDGEVAERLGRSRIAVVDRRNCAGKQKRPKSAPRPPDKEELVRTVGAVYRRHQVLWLTL